VNSRDKSSGSLGLGMGVDQSCCSWLAVVIDLFEGDQIS
jgi:hypothetical protein